MKQIKIKIQGWALTQLIIASRTAGDLLIYALTDLIYPVLAAVPTQLTCFFFTHCEVGRHPGNKNPLSSDWPERCPT